MSGTASVPNTFATQAGNVPASQLDANWTSLVNYVNAREITVGVLGARPVAGTAGRWYLATDVAGGTLYTDNGTSWVQAAAGVVGNKAMLIFNAGTGIGAGATVFFNNADVNATEGSVGMRMPFDGTFTNLRCNSSAVPGAGQDFKYVLRSGFASTALLCTTSGAASSGSEDLTHSVDFSANSQVCIQLATSAGAAACLHWATIQYVPR